VRLVVDVGVVDVLGLPLGFEDAVEVGDDVVEGAGDAAAGVVDAGGAGAGGEDGAVDDVLDVDEVAELLAVLEDARGLSAADLLGELEDHAGGGAFVGLARAVDVEVAEADDDLGGVFAGPAAGEVVELDFGEGVDVGRFGRLVDFVDAGGDAVGGGGGGVDEAGFAALEVVEEVAPRFDVVVGLVELVVVGGVGDGGEMEDEVDFASAEIALEVELGEVAGDEVALVALEVFEVAGAEVVDDGEVGVGEAFGEFVYEVRADKSGAAGDEEVFVHGIRLANEMHGSENSCGLTVAKATTG
jgi:hypothetical protein